MIADADKLLRLFRRRHRIALRPTLVLELSTVDKYMTIDSMIMPTCPTNFDFSGLNALVDLASIPKFSNFGLNLEWRKSFVMDLSTDFKFSMLSPGYYKVRTESTENFGEETLREFLRSTYVQHRSNQWRHVVCGNGGAEPDLNKSVGLNISKAGCHIVFIKKSYNRRVRCDISSYINYLQYFITYNMRHCSFMQF